MNRLFGLPARPGPGRGASPGAARGAAAGGRGPAGPERPRVLRAARAERPRVQQRVQRHVLRREDRRHRAHPPRRPHGHRRRGPAEADPRAVGPDPEARRSGRSTRQTNTIEVLLRYEEFDFDSSVGRHARRSAGFLDQRLPRPAAAGAARGPSGAEPRVPAVRLLREDLPDGRQARASSRSTPPAPCRSGPRRRRSASSPATRPSTTGGAASTWRPTRSRSARRSSSPPRTLSAASRSSAPAAT